MSVSATRKKSNRTPYVQIEVTLIADPRFQDLVRLCEGDDIKALGYCAKAILYTRQYMRNAKLIPRGVFQRAGLEPLITVDLAEVQGDGVYVRGTQRFFGFMAGACLGGKARASQAQRDGGKFAAGEEVSPASSQPLASLQPASHQPQPAPSTGIDTDTSNDPVTETSSSNSNGLKPTPKTQIVSPAQASPEDLAQLWNGTSGTLPKLRGALSDSRKKLAKVRLKEEPELDYWREVIAKMAKSEFCQKGAWATFDWLVKNDTNHRKVAEGNYDNRMQLAPSQGRKTLPVFTEEDDQ